MSDMAGISDLVAQIRETARSIETSDNAFTRRLDGIEASVNELYKKTQRPSFGGGPDDDEASERKDAIGLCIVKHDLTIPKNDGQTTEYIPAAAEIDEAIRARKATRSLFRHGDPSRLDPTERKSLSAFSFGQSSFILPPEMSNRVLSCIVEPSDVSGLVDTVNISGPSLKFLVDNARMLNAAWACEASCFANNPAPDLQEGLGELEIKAETLRYIVCASSDLLQDAAFDVQSWVLRKVSQGFRNTINNAILLGDGIGKPLGFLNPNAGIPVCETSPVTPPGQFSWQDLVMLKYEIPMQWQSGCSYLMNQRTFALLLTMSDSGGRPLWGQLPGGVPGFTLVGSPVIIATQMPDVGPGSTPVLFGNLKQAYTLCNRRATTVIPDPFSAGWCTLFKVDARIGGAPTCPNACRLFRVR